MPLHIIRQDITKMDCDAIVNPTNIYLTPDGGTDLAIHTAAGPELLKYCKKQMGMVQVGGAKISPAFNLPCKHVIHTVGPVWKGGNNNEKDKLISCYKESLELAAINGCSSIAFPLISSGTYGYPKDQVLKIAIDVISDFLFTSEMTVYLVVYDKKAYEFSNKLFTSIASYIDDMYYDEQASFRQLNSFSRIFYEKVAQSDIECEACEDDHYDYAASLDDIHKDLHNVIRSGNIDEWLNQLDESFSQALFRFIDEKGITDVECYKKANIDKKTFSKIKCQAGYKPSKNTAIAFAIALQLSLEETQHLLKTVGYALSRSNKFDLIIEYFITHEIYDIFLINETLFEFDQVCLGAVG